MKSARKRHKGEALSEKHKAGLFASFPRLCLTTESCGGRASAALARRTGHGERQMSFPAHCAQATILLFAPKVRLLSHCLTSTVYCLTSTVHFLTSTAHCLTSACLPFHAYRLLFTSAVSRLPSTVSRLPSTFSLILPTVSSLHVH